MGLLGLVLACCLARSVDGATPNDPENVLPASGPAPATTAARYGSLDPPALNYDVISVDYNGVLMPPSRSPLYVDLAQLRITRYGAREGAPAFPVAMTQSSDGTLWVASLNGLARFDGVKFDKSPGELLPSPTLRSILAGTGNDLWIGYTFGGVSHLDGSTVVNYPLTDFPTGSVIQLARTSEMVVYAMTSTGVARLVDDHWKRISSAEGYPGQSARWIGTYAGSFWIQDGDGAYQLTAGTGRFRRVGDRIPESPSVPIPFRLLSASASDYSMQEKFVDPSGAAWVRTDKGVERYRWLTENGGWRKTTPEKLLSDSDGTSSAPLLTDREGNVWIPMGGGLIQATPTKFTPIKLPDAAMRVVFGPGEAGDMWFGGVHPGVVHASGTFESRPELGSYVGCITRGRDGAVWAVSDTGVRALKGAVAQLFSSDTAKEWGKNCQSIVISERHGVWVSIARDGIYRLQSNQWVAAASGLGLPPGPAIRLFEDEKNRMWLAYPRSQLAMLEGGHVTLWTEKQNLNVGNVLVVYANTDAVWAGGDTGVSRILNGRFVQLTGSGGENFRSCSGLLQRPNGELWLNTGSGVFRIPADEIRKASVDPSYAVTFERYGDRDGIATPATPLRPGPTLQQARDGTLWFSGENSLASIHPERILRNLVKPVVAIRTLTAETGAYAPGRPIEFRPYTRALSIAYTSAALTAPDRIRFRYRLEGADNEWHDVGTRRTAYFTNLDPGEYRFTVEATNEDGVRSATPAVVDFKIRPAVHQTWWFQAICGAAGIALGWWMLRLQLRRSTARVRVLLNERHAERERIARDLHDTLLQDFQGLSLHLQAWSASPDVPEPLRSQLLRAAKATVASLKAGRDKIQLLREDAAPALSLEQAIVRAANHVLDGCEVSFDMKVEGTPRMMTAAAHEETLAIVRECIRNSATHGRASSIRVLARFARSGLVVSIADDGSGFTAAPTVEDVEPGHWGIIGMIERAKLIGARFTVTPGQDGTTAELRIPSTRAFARI
jgi:signal transduction histidine kinase/ligand-binding sensor domain-containing protein